MADISMCRNVRCKSRLVCYRFMADVNEFRQAYANFVPDKGNDRCDYFWDLKTKKQQINENI